MKDPDSIRGASFKLFDLENCEVYLMDRSRMTTVKDVHNSRLFLGPVSENCYLQDCNDCTIAVACDQLTARNLHSCTLYLFCCTRPVLENCTDIKIAPYNYAYPHQDQHFSAANLDLTKDVGTQPVSFEGNSHWEMLSPEKVYEERKDLLGYHPAINPTHLDDQLVSFFSNEADLLNKLDEIPVGAVSIGEFRRTPDFSEVRCSEYDQEVALESSRDHYILGGKQSSPVERVVYLHPAGFVSPNPQPLIVSRCLGELSLYAAKAHRTLDTLFITAYCIFFGAMLWLLLAVILKLIEDWHSGAWGVCLTCIVASACTSGGCVLWKTIKVYSTAKATFSRIAKSAVASGYEIECDLEAATIRRHK